MFKSRKTYIRKTYRKTVKKTYRNTKDIYNIKGPTLLMRSSSVEKQNDLNGNDTVFGHCYALKGCIGPGTSLGE